MNHILEGLWEGDKSQFVKDLTCLMKPDPQTNFMLDKKEIVGILQNVPPTKKFKKRYDNMLQEISSENFKSPLCVEDIINIEQNYSGTRFVDKLRKKLPGVIPSQRRERERKKEYKKEFDAVLLPRRTSTGWAIDPERLLEVLHFKYYWLKKEKFWRVYGDGREIGGRSSTFLSISVLNNEAFLHGILYQSPKEVYPLCIFYESDSRDNLEENLGFPSSYLNDFFGAKMRRNNSFFITGDEMFLEALLDGNKVLSPTSDLGWNIYSETSLMSKEVTDSAGFRTGLEAKIDRQCPSAIFNTVPLKNYIFCLLHGLARSVEKFMNLVVSDILSEANKAQQCGEDRVSYLESKLNALENNINRRGIRQGNFRIHFDKSGKVEPVKLNKDSALTIIAPEWHDHGSSTKFPHVLTNVSTSRPLQKQVKKEVREKLGLKEKYTEAEIERDIWGHFYQMCIILKEDPIPKLIEGKVEGSLDPEDYSWGYTEHQKIDYVHHAECFYQLFVLRYTHKNLTPYMVKFIDYAPLFMKELPFSMGRYQSEGGEHANYLHNCFYYQHTTRHGGRQKEDPILAIFNNIWSSLSYSICSGGTTDNGMKVSKDFEQYVKQHVNAKIIQTWRRMVFFQKQRIRAVLCIQKYFRQRKRGKPFVKLNVSYASKLHSDEEELSFHHYHFAICGTLPVIDGKKYSQATFKDLITNHHGRVCAKLPDSNKLPTKRYTVLTSDKVREMKTIPSQIKSALRNGHKILKFNFVTDSIRDGKLKNEQHYMLDFTKHLKTLPKRLSLESKHFSKRKTMKSLIKGKRKTPWKPKRVTLGNPCLHYVWRNMRNHQKMKKLSFHENRDLFSKLMKQWKNLPLEEKSAEEKAWKVEADVKLQLKKKHESNEFAYQYFFNS